MTCETNRRNATELCAKSIITRTETRSSSTTIDRRRECPKVCILNEDDARSLTYGGIAHKCSSRRHHHYSKNKADALVKAGELVWLGKHKKVATFRNARSWIKTYHRNRYGEVITCGMQLVRGGGAASDNRAMFLPDSFIFYCSTRGDEWRNAAGSQIRSGGMDKTGIYRTVSPKKQLGRKSSQADMLKIKPFLLLLLATTTAYGGTVTGTLQGPSGLPIKNGTLNFSLQQAGLIAGAGSVVPTTASCYTSADGSVVGIPNPLTLPSVSITYGSGTAVAGIYYIVYTFYTNSGYETLASPELKVQMTGTGSMIISPPIAFPPNASGMRIYAGTVSGTETAQGNSTGSTGTFVQNETPVTTSITIPATNTSPCTIAFNDTIIPYSGYNVSLISSSGNAYPGWPQAWQLNGGSAGTVNISNGAPLWDGTIIYPQPILAQPLNHGPQSISGLLNMTGYNLLDVGALGVGTSTPAYPLDVENGYINTNLGYLVAGGAGTTGQCLVSNGTYFGPGSCGSYPTLYYQHAQANGTLLPQEPYFNFTPRFTPVDNPGSTRTDIDLATTAVTPGSYTNPTVTFDAYGRATFATNGTAIPTIQGIVINSGFCTTATSSYASCATGPISWPTAFSDPSYAITCQVAGAVTGTITNVFVNAKTASSFYVTIQNGTSSGAVASTVSEVDCIGIHP